MPDAKVKFEGQEVKLDEQIASDDAKLRAALVTVYPSISTAQIHRTREDGVLVVSVLKQAGPKGGMDQVVASLVEAPEHANPAVALATELRAKDRRGQLSPA